MSGHPLTLFPQDRALFARTRIKYFSKLAQRSRRTAVTFVAWLAGAFFRRNKNNELMAIVRLEDPEAIQECVIFSKSLEKMTMPPSDSLVLAGGTLESFGDKGVVRCSIDRLEPLQSLRKTRVERRHRASTWRRAPRTPQDGRTQGAARPAPKHSVSCGCSTMMQTWTYSSPAPASS